MPNHIERQPTPWMTHAGLLRVAACDLGKATARFAVGTLCEEGALAVESVVAVPHEGQPDEAFAAWYRDCGVEQCAVLAATGLHADLLVAPVVAGLPTDVCLEAALDRPPFATGPLNIVSIGARGYGVLTRDARGRVQWLQNEKCSSGTGETMVKIAGRFGLSIDEADRLAQQADTAIPITARCSVFAKSEMTHFGNQGRPANALFRGYFGSIAGYVAALLARVRVEGPVWVIGGGARIQTLVGALSEAVGQPVVVPEDAQHLEVLGALALAAEQVRAESLAPLPSDPAALIRRTARRFAVYDPPRDTAHRVTRLTAAPVPAGAAQAPCVLGLDLGSTGSKAVLTAIDTGEAVLDLYDRTGGNPVQAAQRLIAALLEQTTPDVRAVALTGSGREAAATVLRAAWPDAADRIVVQNEIVAHGTAAIRCDPDHGRSLSVVEIGGQDAKFIQIRGGQIVESDMNKACSAGTGSFLEEQAVFYGIREIETFTRLAQDARRPPDLGQMCTVFVADSAAEAHGEGFELADLFGGFQYSVVHNYLHRVMGQRAFGDRVFFQGKPATGPALAWTLAAVADREVVVPANPGAMGAWGIGLVTLEQLDPEVLGGAAAVPLSAALDAAVVGRSEFQCKDPRCNTLCTIERTLVEVAGTQRKVLSGGACPKYELSSARDHKLPVGAPSAFAERRALLAPYLVDRPGHGVVGVPAVGALAGVMPWLVTLLSEMGLGVRVLQSDARSLCNGESRCYAYDACAPVKIAHGVIDADLDVIFFPKLLSLPEADGPGGKTCPMEQGLPDIVAASLKARGRSVEIVRPLLSLQTRTPGLRQSGRLLAALRSLGGDARRYLGALQAAERAQASYEDALLGIGRRALHWARRHKIPVVAICGPLHVIHEPSLNAGIPRVLRDNGVLALPLDTLTVDSTVHPMPRVSWAEARRSLQVAVSARSWGDVYPLLLSSFGCGPASFTEHVFSSLMEGYPHTALETDGHGGTAGYVTRVQAFLHAVRSHDGRASYPSRERVAALEPISQSVANLQGRELVIFPMAGRLGEVIAGVYRAHGVDAVLPPPSDPKTLARGRQDCSGKECLPYQLVWSAYRAHLEQKNGAKPSTLLQVAGQGMCRNCMFSVKDRLSLERLGFADVKLRHMSIEPGLGRSFQPTMWNAVVAWDALFQLVSYHRAIESTPGAADGVYQTHCDRLVSLAHRAIRGNHTRFWRAIHRTRSFQVLLADAARDFSKIAGRRPETHRAVLLSGDIYLRLDEFSSDQLIRRLNARGVSVIVEPFSTMAEYMAHERLAELLGLPQDLKESTIQRTTMPRLRRLLYGAVVPRHPWLPMVDPAPLVKASRTLLNQHPQGEAPITVGSVLLHWQERACDGVVVVSPWGCGPALTAESLLRHQREIPTLFVYCDGSPVDERRLNAFAFRLRREPARMRVR